MRFSSSEDAILACMHCLVAGVHPFGKRLRSKEATIAFGLREKYEVVLDNCQDVTSDSTLATLRTMAHAVYFSTS